MFKLGVHKPSQDTPVQRLWRRGQTAATLLRVDASSDVGALSRFDRLMDYTALASGVVRTTGRDRFSAMDPLVGAYLRTAFPESAPLRVHDMAVSSGLAAAQWYERLRADYPSLVFTASDVSLYFIEARREAEGDTFIVQGDGVAIQYIRPPFVVSLLHPQSWLYPVNRMVQWQGKRLWQRVASTPLRIPQAWDALEREVPPVHAGSLVIRRLPLVHPDVMRVSGPSFRIRVQSVFEPLEEPVHVLRTMNILNRSYFGDAQLSAAIEQVGRSVVEGGVWVVGRTVQDRPAINDATVYRRTPSAWEPVLRLGKGSEIEDLVARAPAMD